MRSLKQRFHFERSFFNCGRLTAIQTTLMLISRCSSLTHFERTAIINAKKQIDQILKKWRDPHNKLQAFQSFEKENANKN